MAEHLLHNGHNLLAYRQRFMLSPADLKKTILDCAGGLQSFNCELTELGGQVVSIDPIYATHIEELTQLVDIANTTSASFLTDLMSGRKEGRYLPEKLPFLPFGDEQFELALYHLPIAVNIDEQHHAFQAASLLELCRVAEEVRVFQEAEVATNISGSNTALTLLKQEGYTATHLQTLPGCQMTRIRPIRATVTSSYTD